MATHFSLETELTTVPRTKSAPVLSKGKRVMTREQGCALEIIGHAVDYLNDCYINEGPDEEILDFSNPSMDAVRILISAQRQILHSLPVAEPLTVRLRNAVLRRRSRVKTSSVVPLSSSR